MGADKFVGNSNRDSQIYNQPAIKIMDEDFRMQNPRASSMMMNYEDPVVISP